MDPVVTSPPEAVILGLLRQRGPLSRRELHEQSGLRPNTVGDAAGRLVRRGLLAEGEPVAAGPGRPGVPLTLDAARCTVVGLALQPGAVQGCRINLLGRRLGRTLDARTPEGTPVAEAAADLLRRLVNPDAIAIGVTTPGLLDADTRHILFSSAVPHDRPASARPVFDAAGDLPLRFDNDMTALAVRWRMSQPAPPGEDVLLVHFRDGAVGASLMIGGRPNPGCILGGNELGQTRFPIGGETLRLEEIFSSAFLRRTDGPEAEADARGLAERAARCDPADTAMTRCLDLLALGLANAVNFVRPHRLVLASDLTRHHRFHRALCASMQRTVLPPLFARLRIDPWEAPLPVGAEDAGWLALDLVFREPEAETRG
mgnify:CR=1 FL=1